jgi:phosphoserine aminotransferase
MDLLRKQGVEVYNFSAGPCTLPRSVLEQAREGMLEWDISPMEMSHRSKAFAEIAL